MRHLKAAQHGENGPWHYVSLGRDGGYPIGYCTDACTHETPEEAREHYRQWMLDGFTFDGQEANAQHRCEIDGCEVWTQRLATGPDGYAMHNVCDAHANRESIELLYPEGSIGEAWQS